MEKYDTFLTLSPILLISLALGSDLASWFMKAKSICMLERLF